MYNGHKNWDYWNVSLWLYNDEPLYRLMLSVAKNKNKEKVYYKENRDKILEKCKEKYSTNKEDMLRQIKEYQEKNKERLRERVDCECGEIGRAHV